MEFQNSGLPEFPNAAASATGAAKLQLPDELSDLNLIPLPTHPRIKYVEQPCCDRLLVGLALFEAMLISRAWPMPMSFFKSKAASKTCEESANINFGILLGGSN